MPVYSLTLADLVGIRTRAAQRRAVASERSASAEDAHGPVVANAGRAAEDAANRQASAVGSSTATDLLALSSSELEALIGECGSAAGKVLLALLYRLSALEVQLRCLSAPLLSASAPTISSGDPDCGVGEPGHAVGADLLVRVFRKNLSLRGME